MKVNMYLAEMIGVFAIVFCGTGAIITSKVAGTPLTHLAIAFCFGFMVLAMICSLGDISGAHFNPAITFAFFLLGSMSVRNTLLYILSHFIGALLASLLLYAIFPESATYGETVPTVVPIKAFVIEVIITFILIIVVINVSDTWRISGVNAALAIGVTVVIFGVVAGPVTGGSMNPARSFAPGLVSMKFNHIWIYLIAPFIGAAMAIFFCKSIKCKNAMM